MVEHSKHLRKKVDRVVNKTRQSSLLTTLTTVDASWLDAHMLGYYTSVDRNAGTPLLQFCYGFVAQLVLNFLHSCAAVDKISTDRASCGPSPVAEIL